jgi:hypothetical protein
MWLRRLSLVACHDGQRVVRGRPAGTVQRDRAYGQLPPEILREAVLISFELRGT